MPGWLCWTEKRENPEMTELAGLQVLRVGLLRREGTPLWLLRRRTCAAGRALARAGMRQTILPENFPCWAILAEAGVLPVETLPLWRALAADLAVQALGDRLAGEGRIALCADHLERDVIRTAEALLLRCRYLSLDTPDGDGAFAAELRRRFGAALLSGMAEWDVRLLFSRRTPGEGDIPLYPGAETPAVPLYLPPEWETRLPPGVCREQLIAALWAAGHLPLSQIALTVLDNRKT